MDYLNFYSTNKTFIVQLDTRLTKIKDYVISTRPSNLLDIGCGNGFLLNEISKEIECNLYGIDAFDQESKVFEYLKSDITQSLPFDDGTFDVIVLGEVIEHLPDPDFVLDEIYRVLKHSGKLIVSTPNLASWANRILLMFGIQPLFTETSSRIKLGRRFKFLGQGSKVEGHLKIFTSRSLKEIVSNCNFKINNLVGAPFFFPFPISILDNLFSRIPSLSSGLIIFAEKP